jgi:hypothetical protein
MKTFAMISVKRLWSFIEKITNLSKYKVNNRLGAKVLHNSLRQVDFKKKSTYATRSLFVPKFMRHIVEFLPTSLTLVEIQTRLIESLPSLYADNYERVTEENVEELCNIIIDSELLNIERGKGSRKKRKKQKSRKVKLGFNKSKLYYGRY